MARAAPPIEALSPEERGVLLGVECLRAAGPLACLGAGPLVVEIGFGRADLLLALAPERPEARFLGIERSRKRVLKAARRVVRAGLENVRLVEAPAEVVLQGALPAGAVSECFIVCPDPWPKKRHYRRRLVQPPFLALLVRALAAGARLHLSTDHEGYALFIDSVLSKTEGLANDFAPGPWSSDPPARPVTVYERGWLAQGRRIAYFEYRKSA